MAKDKPIMTLDQARKNEQGWQNELREATRIFQDLKKQGNVSAKELFKAKKRVDAAQNALNWYNGDVECKYEMGSDGRPKYDEDGRFIYTDEIARRRTGAIQQLSGKAQELKKQSNLGERFDSRTFATFDKSRDANAYKQASLYAESENLFKERGNGRIFIGGTGVGKTHLAAAITNVLVGREIPVLFATFSEHLTKIKNQFNTPDDGKHLEEMKSVMMLVIDDLGAELDREWSNKILYEVVNYRYEHMLPLIVTTNLTTHGLQEQYEDRVYSRLFETCEIITMKGSDYRTRGN